ncbi:MAG: 4-hydroxy-3-methylbut-2-enyl diphosphate reductase [Rhodothermales bacterium]|nr:4-hydroxy-3-methylbut-2-enyl diphosphate reductase [Rhodothermales bacterium]MBO6778025.1 4-hydroxy-3-methylbut-2-enyl diphosphate reductase [Rhodothermales bacterium]
MARSFDVPEFYRSPIVSAVKQARRLADPRKRDLAPSVLDFGPVRIKLARHFGFCYGVENAIEIAYRALSENPGKRIFLLSEMIHNPHVNDDLRSRGIEFLRSTTGEQLIPFDTLGSQDVVIIPAFGASLEVKAALEARGVDLASYDTTCPFVEKVWKRSSQIGRKDYSIVVHGKRYHEETRATFSHAKESAPVVVVRDLKEAQTLAEFVLGERDPATFSEVFPERYSEGFDPQQDLRRIGVVNQTTMLATETAAIAALLRDAMIRRYGEAALADHFADTSDTLCYATNENQDATKALIADGADVAVVVGGFNSSNTSHLVELCEQRMPTYFVGDADALDRDRIRHFDYPAKQHLETADWLPDKRPLDVLVTAGASCPDVLIDGIIRKIVGWYPDSVTTEEALAPLLAEHSPAA